MPFFDCHANDHAAAGFDDVAADDPVGGPVGALHQDVRLDRGDDGVRIVLVEDDDGIDDGERRQDLRALLLGVIGRAGPLMARTDRSEFTATISASPCARASAR